jgi:hypothetical protein
VEGVLGLKEVTTMRKMVADHLRASELFAIDIRTPEGLASLTTILGQALQAGLTAGEAQREEARKAAEAKAAEAKAAEKKRKRDEKRRKGGKMRGMPSERRSSTWRRRRRGRSSL